MSLVLDPKKSLIEILIMYVEEKKKHGNIIFHFINSKEDLEKWQAKGYNSQDKIAEHLSQPIAPDQPGMPARLNVDPDKKIEELKTTWKRLNWREHNEIYSRCIKTITGPDGTSRSNFDWLKFREYKLKACLKSWDLKDDDGTLIPCTGEMMDSLDPDAASELLNQFEKVTESSEEDLKN